MKKLSRKAYRCAEKLVRTPDVDPEKWSLTEYPSLTAWELEVITAAARVARAQEVDVVSLLKAYEEYLRNGRILQTQTGGHQIDVSAFFERNRTLLPPHPPSRAEELPDADEENENDARTGQAAPISKSLDALFRRNKREGGAK